MVRRSFVFPYRSGDFVKAMAVSLYSMSNRLGSNLTKLLFLSACDERGRKVVKYSFEGDDLHTSA